MAEKNLPAPLPAGQLTTLDDMTLGQVLAQSGYFEDARQAAQCVVKVLAGREMGIPPVQSMLGIHIIKGKPAIGAGLVASQVKRSGRYDYRVRRHDETGCEIEFFQGSESLGLSSFTVEDAKRAQLTGNPMWSKYPRNMCFARAMTEGVRTYCPDVFGPPVYTPEELGAEVTIDAAGEQVPVLPPARRQANRETGEIREAGRIDTAVHSAKDPRIAAQIAGQSAQAPAEAVAQATGKIGYRPCSGCLRPLIAPSTAERFAKHNIKPLCKACLQTTAVLCGCNAPIAPERLLEYLKRDEAPVCAACEAELQMAKESGLGPDPNAQPDPFAGE